MARKQHALRLSCMSTLVQLFVQVLMISTLAESQSKEEEKLEVVIQTNHGGVRGCMKDFQNGLKAWRFFGIPYAKPPVGELRWRAPQPAEPWKEVLDGCESYPPRCLQQQLEAFPVEDRGPTSEDCLYLNIFTPNTATKRSNLTVMLWIHGGGLVMGSGNDQDGSYLASSTDVIVVTINYRLGLLGFMPFYGTPSSGNYGILDMIASLKWVKENIVYFGGNPNSITIFGMSSGADSVSLLRISPLAKGLFRRAIAQSGSVIKLCDFIHEPNYDQVTDFSATLGCTGDMQAIVDCMRAKDAEEIIEAQRRKVTFTVCECPLLQPYMDGNTFTKPAMECLKSGEVNGNEHIIGMTKDENSFEMPDKIDNPEMFLKSQLEELLPSHMENRKAIVYAMIHECTPANRTDNEVWKQNINLFISDMYHTWHWLQEAELLSTSGRKVFVYVLSHRNRNSIFPLWKGVPHAEEIAYVFGAPFFKLASGYLTAKSFTDMERGLSLAIMRMWSNFAKNGDPSIEADGISWPPFQAETKLYLDIELTPKVKSNVLSRSKPLFNDYILSLLNPDKANDSL